MIFLYQSLVGPRWTRTRTLIFSPYEIKKQGYVNATIGEEYKKVNDVDCEFNYYNATILTSKALMDKKSFVSLETTRVLF